MPEAHIRASTQGLNCKCHVTIKRGTIVKESFDIEPPPLFLDICAASRAIAHVHFKERKKSALFSSQFRGEMIIAHFFPYLLHCELNGGRRLWQSFATLALCPGFNVFFSPFIFHVLFLFFFREMPLSSISSFHLFMEFSRITYPRSKVLEVSLNGVLF